jgi:putative acetyltransferase
VDSKEVCTSTPGTGSLPDRGDEASVTLVDSPHVIRLISSGDDASVAAIIRSVMPEFAASGPGFALQDAEVGAMSQAYCAPRSAYFVIEHAGQVVGGAGVAPLAGGQFEVCELRKMYFLPSARGHGMGALLLRHCLRVARGFGYQTCYLETLSGMHAARHLYERAGFRPLSGPLGATGHFSCDHWFAIDL